MPQICVDVSKLQDINVGWYRADDQLTHNADVYADRRKFSVINPYRSEWNLRISQVEAGSQGGPGDAGIYECRISRQLGGRLDTKMVELVVDSK